VPIADKIILLRKGFVDHAVYLSKAEEARRYKAGAPGSPVRLVGEGLIDFRLGLLVKRINYWVEAEQVTRALGESFEGGARHSD
jgi:hypothetical protein